MFNLYIAEKKRKIIKDKQLIEEKENKIKETRKKILPELLNKYQSRVENFVLDMAHSPIVVKDIKDMVNNPRQELFEESKKKIIGRKGIVLKGFITEKKRIEMHLKELEMNENKTNKEINKNHYENLNNKINIIQPELRFKPRTDMERIFEEINKNSSRSLDRKIIDNQIREIRSRKSIKSNESSLNFKDSSKDITKNSVDDKNDEEQFSFKEVNEIDDHLNNLKIQKEEEEKKKIEKNRTYKNPKKELNQEAKKILKEFHYKTHFKAVSTIANYYKERNPNFKKEKNSYNTKSLEKKDLNFNENIYEENDILNSRNNLSYKLNMNPYIYHDKSRLRSDEYSLRYLKEIAKSITLRNNNEEANSIIEEKSKNNIEKISSSDLSSDFIDRISKKVIKHNRVSFKENLVEQQPEDKKIKLIMIDNENFNISNQINVIANKILHKCNLTKEKNENNNTKLISGHGKLSITNGLSIKEFEKRNGLKQI